ncbi:MAG: SH3 domain-containing protein [Blastocatellia bacterium]|nr:SH3 domain-containing protein [Blastocatellia bacterium]
MKYLSAVLILALCCVAVAAQERYVKPVDEAAKDASFAAFRQKTIAAAEKRDVRYIISILDPDIKISFGIEQGAKEFVNTWRLNDKDSPFWDEFLRVIKNGGAFAGDGKARDFFTAPYTFSSWPEDIDGFEYHAIFGRNVNLRERASTDSKVVTQLSYNIVKVDRDRSVRKAGDPDDVSFDWMYVETLGGKKGFVKAEYVRSHVDYRAGFNKTNGVWRMTLFLAGD